MMPAAPPQSTPASPPRSPNSPNPETARHVAGYFIVDTGSMARFLAIFLLACMNPAPANVTIVVIAASASGLVIAGDSGTSLLGTRCDDQYKITEVRRPHRTAVAVTGNVVFIKPPEARETDVCQYLESAPRMLDIPSVVKTYLEHKVRDFSKLSLEDLASECVAVSQRFQSANPGVFNSAPGGEIFSVVIVNRS